MYFNLIARFTCITLNSFSTEWDMKWNHVQMNEYMILWHMYIQNTQKHNEITVAIEVNPQCSKQWAY